MAPTQPTPSTWTIRFRHHRTTVLLPIDPLQSISSIKSDLFAALQQTTPTGRLSDATPLPDSSHDILLARPVDINNPDAGWRALPTAKGGKASAGKAKGKSRAGLEDDGVDAESLKSLGIKDNALLAFKFASSSPGEKRTGEGREPDHYEEDEDDELATMDVDDGTPEEWDVVMPSWDDQYGVTNTGDAGALKEFNG